MPLTRVIDHLLHPPCLHLRSQGRRVVAAQAVGFLAAVGLAVSLLRATALVQVTEQARVTELVLRLGPMPGEHLMIRQDLA